MAKRLRITWVKSTVGCSPRQERVIEALGLHKLNDTVYHDNTPQIRGMINKISHLLTWSEE